MKIIIVFLFQMLLVSFSAGAVTGQTGKVISVPHHQSTLVESFNVEVTHDINTLKAKLHQFLPNERIEVHSSQEKIVLKGLVTSQQNMKPFQLVRRQMKIMTIKMSKLKRAQSLTY